MGLFKKKNKSTATYRVRYDGWLYFIDDEVFTSNQELATSFNSMEDALDMSLSLHHDDNFVIIENKDGRVKFYNLDEAKEWIGY